MTFQTRKNIRTFARILPVVAIATAAVVGVTVLLSGSFFGASPVWLVPLLMALMMVCVNSDVGALRPYNAEPSPATLPTALICVLFLLPLALLGAINPGLPEGQALSLLLATICSMLGSVVVMVVLEVLVRPVHQMEAKRFLLQSLEMAEDDIVKIDGALPKAFVGMVQLTREQATILSVADLERTVKRLQDYANMARIMRQDTQ